MTLLTSRVPGASGRSTTTGTRVMSGSPGYPLTTVKVYTVARPDSSVQSTAADWHRQQNGVGGSRNVPQSAHRGATSRRSLAACQNGSVLGSVEILTAPAGSAVASFPGALIGHARGSARLSAARPGRR